jgi:hypothetical protein
MPFFVIGSGGGTPGGGDMDKSVYDTNNNGVVDKVDTLPTDSLLDGEMVRFDSATGEMEGAGDINTDLQVDFGDKDLLCKSVVTEAASVDVGAGLTLSDNGGDLQLTSNVTGKQFIAIDSRVEDSGSFQPEWGRRDPKEYGVIIQPDFSQTQNVSSVEYTTIDDSAVDKLYLKSGASHTNFRFEVVSNSTGETIRYYPNRHDFSRGIGDSIGVGDVTFEFPAVRVPEGQTITVNFFADEPILLSTDPLGVPYFAVDRQIVTDEQVITAESDAMLRMMGEKSTQVSSGLAVSADGALGVATTFSVSSGSIDLFGVAYNLDRFDSGVVSFDAVNAVTPLYSTPALNYVIAQFDGSISVRPFPPSNLQRRTECLIGIVVFDGVVITEVVPVKFNYRQVGNQLADFMDAVGNLKVNDDGTIFPATVGGLALSHTDIDMFGSNINFLEPRDPHARTYVAQDPITNMSRYLGDGTLNATGLTNIDPANYNPAGGNTYVAMPGGANRAQIIQVWMRVDTGEPIYLPGQTDYTSISAATAAFVNYRPTLPEVIRIGAVKLGSIIVRAGATDLSDEGDAIFVPTTKFGDVNPLAEPISDIEPTPVNGNRVYYDLALNKLVDTGEYSPVNIVGSNFTIPAGVRTAKYIVENVASDITITLPDTTIPDAKFEFEFVNSRRAFGGWGVSGFNVIVTWNDGVDDYFVTLTPDPLKGDQDYESYTFRFDFNEWRFTYNG